MRRPYKSTWGGKRPGAGRKRKLETSDRKQIAKTYFARRRRDEESRPARRKSVISELMDEFGTTHRMVDRAIAEFLPEIRSEAKIWAYATEGMNEINTLPARKLEKLKAGVYADRDLRLIVDTAGNRQWIFRFIWRSTGRDMVLGGSEMPLAMARERAIEAGRKVAAGQNPIDRSWLSPALQRVADLKRSKSKS
jgi:Arm domain-containing DNA-binding protein